MESDYEYIRTLLFEKMAGVIRTEDEQYINDLIKKDVKVSALWDEIVQHFNSEQGRQFTQSFDESTGWHTFRGQTATKSVNYLRWASVAALLVAILSVGLLFFRNKNAQNVQHAANIHPKAGIKLVLANGKQIDLSAKEEHIDINDAAIVANQSKLAFQKTATEKTSWSTLVVPKTLNYKMTLPDGTEVWLNALSSIKFPSRFPDSIREVYISGEAYLKVTKNPKQPFIVHTKLTDIRVLGTEFNVNDYHDDVCITSLVQGRVSSSSKDNQQVVIKPGYEAFYSTHQAFNVRVFNPEKVTSWMAGVYYFTNQPLADIAEVLYRWYDVKIVFDTPAIRQELFSGAIKKEQSLPIFLSNLEASYHISHYMKENELHLLTK